jgi:hypothetical protein
LNYAATVVSEITARRILIFDSLQVTVTDDDARSRFELDFRSPSPPDDSNSVSDDDEDRDGSGNDDDEDEAGARSKNYVDRRNRKFGKKKQQEQGQIHHTTFV